MSTEPQDVSSAYFRAAGTGPNVLCLHSSLGSSKQWSNLCGGLCENYRIIATDLYGHGKSPEWEASKKYTLAEEVALIDPVLGDLDGPVHLVGHSYGAALALKVALCYPERIKSMTLYEPVWFSALFRQAPTSPAALEIQNVVSNMYREHQAGKSQAAARRFVDYWSGDGAWECFTEEQHASMTTKVPALLRGFEALVDDPALLSDFAVLEIPTLYMYGSKSPRSTREVAQILSATLPQAELYRLEGFDHMAPITHASLVNRFVLSFLDQHAAVDSKKIALAA